MYIYTHTYTYAVNIKIIDNSSVELPGSGTLLMTPNSTHSNTVGRPSYLVSTLSSLPVLSPFVCQGHKGLETISCLPHRGHFSQITDSDLCCRHAFIRQKTLWFLLKPLPQFNTNILYAGCMQYV